MHVPYAQLYVAMSRPPADPPAQGRRRARGETTVLDPGRRGDAAARRAGGLWSRLRHRSAPTAAPAPLPPPPATAFVPRPRERADEPVRH